MLVYAVIGALCAVVQVLIRKNLQKVDKAKLFPNCFLMLIANVSVFFSIAWAYASILEYEMQAAMMGLLVFGGMGVLLGIGTYRFAIKE